MPKARVGNKLRYIRYANYYKLDTLAGLARSSDKKVTNLFSLTEDSQYSSYHLQCIVTPFFGFVLYVIYTIKWPLPNAIRNPWGPQTS